MRSSRLTEQRPDRTAGDPPRVCRRLGSGPRGSRGWGRRRRARSWVSAPLPRSAHPAGWRTGLPADRRRRQELRGPLPVDGSERLLVHEPREVRWLRVLTCQSRHAISCLHYSITTFIVLGSDTLPVGNLATTPAGDAHRRSGTPPCQPLERGAPNFTGCSCQTVEDVEHPNAPSILTGCRRKNFEEVLVPRVQKVHVHMHA